MAIGKAHNIKLNTFYKSTRYHQSDAYKHYPDAITLDCTEVGPVSAVLAQDLIWSDDLTWQPHDGLSHLRESTFLGIWSKISTHLQTRPPRNPDKLNKTSMVPDTLYGEPTRVFSRGADWQARCDGTKNSQCSLRLTAETTGRCGLTPALGTWLWSHGGNGATRRSCSTKRHACQMWMTVPVLHTQCGEILISVTERYANWWINVTQFITRTISVVFVALGENNVTFDKQVENWEQCLNPPISDLFVICRPTCAPKSFILYFFPDLNCKISFSF